MVLAVNMEMIYVSDEKVSYCVLAALDHC